MHKTCGYWLCTALVLLQSPAAAQSLDGFDTDTTKRAAIKVERAWLDHEIGRFASGREAVFSGAVKVTQRDHEGRVVEDGKALATLSGKSPQTLTILFPKTQRWLRLTQNRGAPGVTEVTRLRDRHSSNGVSARCTDCMAPFAARKEEPLFLRVAAEGALLNVAQSRFAIEVTGYLERIPPAALRLEQILMLRPDLEAWLRRPDAAFVTRGREAVRDIASVLVHRAPPPGGDFDRFLCNFETRYTAQHHVTLTDLTRFSVRNLTLGETDLCCVDHHRHDGSKICDGEFPQ